MCRMDSAGSAPAHTGQCDDEIRLISTVRHAYSIVAVSLADDRLFILMRRGFNRLIVYDAEASPPLELYRLRVDGHGDSVKGMAACSVNRCIYLSNDSKHAVFKVKLPDDTNCRQAGNGDVGGDQETPPKSALTSRSRWHVAAGPMGLTITPEEHHLLVACADDRRLQEFTSTGVMMSNIRLNKTCDRLDRPVYAVKLPKTAGDQLYAVSIAGNEPHRVCIVSVQGRALMQFGSSPDAERVPRIDEPNGLAVATRTAGGPLLADGILSSSDHDHWFLVADWCHDRVVAVSGDMKSSVALLPPLMDNIYSSSNHSHSSSSINSNNNNNVLLTRRLSGPKCLCIDEKRGRLFVGEFRGRQLLEYSFPVSSYDYYLP
jgi:hypothetical protein